MDSSTYLNFDLLIQRAINGYRAQVIESPAGQATVNFVIPFSEEKLENYLLKIGRPRRGGTRSYNSPEVEAAKSFGDSLFNAIFKDEVRGCLRSSLDQAKARGCAGLRIRLRLTDVPELADLPWEFLYNKSRNKFLALSTQTPLVRFLELPERIEPLSVRPPLRILAIISSPTDYPLLDVEQEWSNLRKALAGLERRGLIRLERLGRATPRALQYQLRRGQYHVFHFIGHGGFDKQTQDGVLIFENSEKRGLRVNGEFLATMLDGHRPMRLAVLNACEGARGAINDPFAGVAQSLVQQGMPAVIAMQFEITDKAAITFAQEFYHAIADNLPVDAALTDARKIIFTQGNCLEWGTPVLYLRSPHGHVFDVEQLNDAERKQLQQIASLYSDALLAAKKEAWEIAIKKLQAILELDHSQTDVAAKLEQAEEHQYLMALYAEGLSHSEAGLQDEALQCFLKVQEVKNGYKDINRLVAQLEERIAREENIASIRRTAQSAMNKHDWNTAINRLQSLINLEPTDDQAKADLKQAEQQLELSNLYDEGRKSYEAERWSEALNIFTLIRDKAGGYRDIDALLVNTELEIEKARRSKKVREQLAVLYKEVERAKKAGDWLAVSSILQKILAITPNDEKALALFQQAKKQSEIVNIYAAGREHYEHGRWQQALACFNQIRNIAGSYKDSADFITRTQNKIKAEEFAHLHEEAEEAIRREDWKNAEEKFRSLLAVDSFKAIATSRLAYISQQRELALLYEDALKLYDAARLEEALKTLSRIQDSNRGYKDVTDLVEKIETESRKGEALKIYERACVEMSRDNWDSVIEDLRTAQTLDPDNPEYTSRLKYARQQQKLLQLYKKGLQHYQDGHRSKAQQCFAHVLKVQPDYKDAAVLLAEVKLVHEEIAASTLVKYCPICRTEYPENDKFCELDGSKLEEKRKQAAFIILYQLWPLITKYKLILLLLLGLAVAVLVISYFFKRESGPIRSPDATSTNQTKRAAIKVQPAPVADQLALQTFGFRTVKVNEDGTTGGYIWGAAKHFNEDLGGVTLSMVKIDGGDFLMGATAEETSEFNYPELLPQHRVTVPSFYMGMFEVTRAQWNAVAKMEPPVNIRLRSNPSAYSRSDRTFRNEVDKLPVTQVTWYEAREFCDRLTRHTGYKRSYRLPTEAEWEYAARAHTKTRYAFGQTIDLTQVNYDGSDHYKQVRKGEPRRGPTPKGHYDLANQFGLYDMHGNVWEWCLDVMHDNYKGAPEDGSKPWEDLDAPKNAIRVLRGGSFWWPKSACRSATRYSQTPINNNGGNIGFRVVCKVS